MVDLIYQLPGSLLGHNNASGPGLDNVSGQVSSGPDGCTDKVSGISGAGLELTHRVIKLLEVACPFVIKRLVKHGHRALLKLGICGLILLYIPTEFFIAR